KKYYSWARWVDPGFVLRRQYPQVSAVSIHAPGYNLEDFVPAVRATGDGSAVDSRILSVSEGGPMDILFDTSDASLSYLVYLVPKSRAGTASSSWEPKAGLILETKWSKKGFAPEDRLPEFAAAFDGIAESVGRSLVDDIQHVFPIHRTPDHDGGNHPNKGGHGLYRYRGFFQVNQAGTYSFATMSNWDSYLAVDGKLVIGWPGKHNQWDGRRGEKQGTVSLSPGVHKLEYYNYSPWGRMYCLAAWKKPGDELRPMTRTDFLAVGQYRPILARLNDPDKIYVPFEWSTIDEFRTEQTGRAFVTMRFDGLIPPGSGYSCRWTFDDGIAATGRTVEHVFLRQGLRKVQLEVRSEDKVVGRTSDDVYVHGRWDKTIQNLKNADSYGEVIRTRNFDKVPADDIVNLSLLADVAERPDWKTIATAALIKNLPRLVRESDDANFMFDFGRHLQSAKLGQHGKALELFSRMAGKASLGKSITDRAKVHQAEILVKYFGKYDEALKTLGKQGAGGSGGHRAVLARAQAMLGLKRAAEATNLIRKLGGAVDVKREIKIKHSGMIRHARLLAETEDDPNELDHASAMIETLIAEDAAKVFSPNVNLVALDIHLARREFEPALYLAERLQHLQLNDYDRAEILTRHVVASCGLKDLDRARTGYAKLSKDYPYSPALSDAKKAIMQTFGQR
ncbi:MAG: PKD domain-containing protein, partial [Planctomycetota bacterium]